MFIKEAHRFKAGEDLDDLCARLKTPFRKHGMDAITHRNNPNKDTQMMAAFDLHLTFTIESMKVCNTTVRPNCDTHDKQSNDDAIECFMNSSGEDPRQQI